MTKDDALTALRAHMATLWEGFGVTELRLFGSFACGQGSDTSDVDVLVRFDRAIHWKRHFDAQFYVQDLLGRPWIW